MFRFNPIKSYGIRTKGDEWINFILIFKGAALLAILPLIFYLGRYSRTHHKFDEKELAESINNINLGMGMNRSITVDSIVVTRYDTFRYNNILHTMNQTIGYDSVFVDVKNDSALHCFSMNQFRNISEYYEMDSVSHLKGYLSGKEIYYRLLQLRTKADTMQIYKNMVESIGRFATWNKAHHAELMYEISRKTGQPLGEYVDDSISTLQIHRFNEDLGKAILTINLNQKYYAFFNSNTFKEFLHAIYYLAFYCALFILVYRNMTLKTFMISIGVGILIPILAVLIAVAANLHEDHYAFMLALVIYLATWGVYFATRSIPRRSLAAGISLNIVMATSPLLGWFLAEWWINNYEASFATYEDNNWVLINQVRWAGEIGGMAVFLILLQPLFKRLYVYWYSLPEE
jgi:hypothetical protein